MNFAEVNLLKVILYTKFLLKSDICRYPNTPYNMSSYVLVSCLLMYWFPVTTKVHTNRNKEYSSTVGSHFTLRYEIFLSLKTPVL